MKETKLDISKDICKEIGGRWSISGCVVSGKVHPEIKEAIEKKGLDWIIGAMMKESQGYYLPIEAEPILRDYFKGRRKSYTRRCYSLYGGDLEKMLLSDIRGFKDLEKFKPEKANRIVDSVKEIRKRPPIEQRGPAGYGLRKHIYYWW